MGMMEWLKTYFVLGQLLFGFVFVVSGLVVCFLMLLTWILVWPFNKTLYRKICCNLAYTHWCQLTFLAQWWSGSDCTLAMEKPEDFEKIGKEHCIVLMNHKYDIDWLMAWILAERFAMLGGTKIYGKSSLKMVPLIGWAWTFTESIFLKREWEKDREIISRDLRYVTDYPDNYWITLLLFCEGTRFTESKHKLSNEVARKKGLPELKHHLLPRTKGFVHSMNGLKGKVPTILDLTVGFRPGTVRPTLMSVLQGKAFHAEMYVRRIPIDSVPTNTDEECAAWLHGVYQEKDAIYDKFARDGTYKDGQRRTVPRRVNDLVTFLVWATLILVPLFYYTGHVVYHGTWLVQLGVAFLLVAGTLGVRKMIAVSEIQKSSSAYGKTSPTRTAASIQNNHNNHHQKAQ